MTEDTVWAGAPGLVRTARRVEDTERCATCSAACPVHTDTSAYVDLIARGRYEEAFEVIRRFNPFPSVCALVCHHPCEQECRRGSVDEPVALRNLKRFAVEQALEHRVRSRSRVPATTGKTIGIIGAGPAGLTAAHDLVRGGHAVTVYDEMPAPGGLLAWAVPRYRLPVEALRRDIDDILSLGVQVESRVRVGRDVSMDTLRERHDAVVVATGLPLARTLDLRGGGDDVLTGLDFLRSAARGDAPRVPSTVLVVGGGDVAVDVARTALRLGAETVRLVCLESADELPAWDWECREALEEGIEFIHRRGPAGLLRESGRVTGLRLRAVQRVFDGDGRFDPVYDDADTMDVSAGLVILAIGQAADKGFARAAGLVGEAGNMAFDSATMATALHGVFACGEAVTGPGAAIEAVASGHRAAAAVKGLLDSGRVASLQTWEPAPLDPLPGEVARRVRRVQRIAMPTIAADKRRRSFLQFELGYSEQEALREARRCLACSLGAQVDSAKCESCLACLRVCPFGVPAVDDVAVMSSDLCQSCGLCVVECPARAISTRTFDVGDVRSRTRALIESAVAPVSRVELRCTEDATTREELADRIVAVDGETVAVVCLRCAALADEVDMMVPFDYGVETVSVVRCNDCRYTGAAGRLARRVERVRALLDAAGFEPARLELL